MVQWYWYIPTTSVLEYVPVDIVAEFAGSVPGPESQVTLC